MELVFVAFVAAAVLALWASARAAITICILDIAAGTVTVRKGGIAPRVLADIRDMAVRPPIAGASVRIVRDRGHAGLQVTGTIPAPQLQQLRNIVGTVPLQKLTNARQRRK